MDDLKIIVYLLVGLGWLILRNYRKVQQQRPRMIGEEPSPGPAPEPPAEAIRRKRDQAAGPGAPSRATAKKILPETPEAEPDYAFGAVDEEGRRVTEYFERLRHADLPDMQETEEKSTGQPVINAKNFDLRRAVLYSEILKRPDW